MIEGIFLASTDGQLLWRARARALEKFPHEQVPKITARWQKSVFAIYPSGADPDSLAHSDHSKALREYLDEDLKALYKDGQPLIEVFTAEPMR